MSWIVSIIGFVAVALAHYSTLRFTHRHYVKILCVLDYLYKRREAGMQIAPTKAHIALALGILPRAAHAALVSLERMGMIESSPDLNMSPGELDRRGGHGRSVWRVKGL